MKTLRIFLAILASSLLAMNAEAGVMDSIKDFFYKLEEPKDAIKVLIAHDMPGAVVEVKGKYKLYDPNTMNHITTRYTGKRKFIQPLRDGLKWGEEFPGIFQLLIVPDDAATTTLIDGIEYRGWIYVYDIGGGISIVNAPDLGEYIGGLMSVGIPKDLPDEVMAALAISLRTQAYFQVQNPKNRYWAVDGRKIGYQGHALIDPSGSIEKAVDHTRKMVLSESDAPIGEIRAFPSQWPGITVGVQEPGVMSKITIDEAVHMADQGSHAAQILVRAFPNTSIQMLK